MLSLENAELRLLSPHTQLSQTEGTAWSCPQVPLGLAGQRHLCSALLGALLLPTRDNVTRVTDSPRAPSRCFWGIPIKFVPCQVCAQPGSDEHTVSPPSCSSQSWGWLCPLVGWARLGDVSGALVALQTLYKGAQNSQDPRIVWVRRDLGDHPVQAPAQEGPPRAGDTGAHPGGFGMSPARETPALPGQLCPLHRKKFFLMLRWKFLWLRFWPFLLVLSLNRAWPNPLAPLEMFV